MWKALKKFCHVRVPLKFVKLREVLKCLFSLRSEIFLTSEVCSGLNCVPSHAYAERLHHCVNLLGGLSEVVLDFDKENSSRNVSIVLSFFGFRETTPSDP